MLQRMIAAGLVVLGLVGIGVGIASATVLRADGVLVARTQPSDGVHYVVTAPGVLDMAGPDVTVTVTAAGDVPVVLAVGRDTDVTGWLGQDAAVQVTGLADRSTLATSPATRTPTPAPSASGTPTGEAVGAAASPTAAGAAAGSTAVADPAGSDLWVAQATGVGSASLDWTRTEGRWSLLAAAVGPQPPVVTLSWPQTVTTPWLWPGVVGGALLLLAGLALAWWTRRREGPAAWHAVTTGTVPVVTGPQRAVTGPQRAVTGPQRAVTGPQRAVTGPQSVAADAAPAAAPLLTRRQVREAEEAARRRPRLVGADRGPGGVTPTPGADSQTTGQVALSTGPARRDTGDDVPEGEAAAPPPSRRSPSGGAVSGRSWHRPPDGPAGSDAPPAADAVPAELAARADAWRRAWGFPAGPSGGSSDRAAGSVGGVPPAPGPGATGPAPAPVGADGPGSNGPGGDAASGEVVRRRHRRHGAAPRPDDDPGDRS